MELAAAASGAVRWIDSVGVGVEGGRRWLEAGEAVDDLYSGTAGVLLGCAELEAAGIDASAVSVGARSRLLHLVDAGWTMSDDGLFSGRAGVAAALQAWADATGDPEAAAGAVRVRSQLAARVLTAPRDPGRYTDVIQGDAGVLLTLLAGPADDALTEAATVLADGLVALAEPSPDGPQWRMLPDYPVLMPGFSHGTAGVAYALLAAGRRLDRPDLIEVAVRGATTLLALGHTADGWALPLTVPRSWHRPPVSFGWCHGPTGTVRLFVALAGVDPDPRWPHAVDACLQAVATSGLPARRWPGFWDNLGRCCGTAGVGTLLLDRHRVTDEADLLDRVDVLAADVLDRALVLDVGVAWGNTEHTAEQPELPPEPGFMQGAAGVAGWLARVNAVHAGRDPGPGTPWV